VLEELKTLEDSVNADVVVNGSATGIIKEITTTMDRYFRRGRLFKISPQDILLKNNLNLLVSFLHGS
jgi:hypothetical protein